MNNGLHKVLTDALPRVLAALSKSQKWSKDEWSTLFDFDAQLQEHCRDEVSLLNVVESITKAVRPDRCSTQLITALVLVHASLQQSTCDVSVLNKLSSMLVALCLQHPFRDLEAMFGARTPESNVRLAEALRMWLPHLPYGKKGTAAYKSLLDASSRLQTKTSVHTVISRLVEAGDDRRGAELLLWHTKRSDEHQSVRLTSETLLHHAACGIPCDEVWDVLRGQHLVARAKNEAETDIRQRNLELRGRWEGGNMELFLRIAKGGCEAELVLNGRTYKGSLKSTEAADTPAPHVEEAQYWTRLDGGGVAWLQLCESSASHLFGPQLAMHYSPDGSEWVETATLRRDEIGSESTPAFAARALQQVLQSPPGDTLVTDLETVLENIPRLSDSLLSHIESGIGLQKCHPMTLIIVLRVLEKRVREFKAAAWLLGQGAHHPCMNLVALYGGAYEDGASFIPAEMVTALKRVAHTEYHRGDPVGIIKVLNSTMHHDYDGTWDWLNGVNGMNYLKAFAITGHHIVLLHPLLHGEVDRISYTGTGVSFRLMLGQGFSSQVTVALRRRGKKVEGSWVRQHEREERPSEFICTPHANDATPVWGAKAVSSTGPELVSVITTWDAARFNVCTSAEEFVTQIITDTRGKNPDHEKHVLQLWQLAVKQITNRPWTGLTLDTWILQQDLCTLQGFQRKAAQLLLAEYFSSTTVAWCDPPISYRAVQSLSKVYSAASDFMQQIKSATLELQGRLSDHRMSRMQYATLSTHQAVHEANGLKLPKEPLNFQAPAKSLEKIKSVLRQLTTSWHVVGAQELLANVESQLVNKHVNELRELEELVTTASSLLGPMLQHQDAVASPLLHAHFVKLVKDSVDLKHFVATFEKARAALLAVTSDTLVREAVADLHPPRGRVSGARLKQEQSFLGQLGCSEEVVTALTEGALPLRFAVHDLQILRQFIDNPRPDLQLRADFLTEEEKELLLDASLDNVALRGAVGQKKRFAAATAAELHPVLELMRTMYNCSELVEFTRLNPEAQDAGLANVLSNSRDLQHASFQTFLNCTAFINPFIAASAAYETAYEELKEKRKAANGTGPSPREVEYLGVPLLASQSVSSGDGFWKVLSDLASNGSTDIKGVQRSLQKMSTRDQIEGLQKMINEQNGSTDLLIQMCEQACDSTNPATLRIHLPAARQPYLECEIGEVTKSGPEYQDLVYRAALQRNIDTKLETFTSQAREVVRAFNAACTLHSEGHIEFRSRVLTLLHTEGAHTTAMLQALHGTWSQDSSALQQACVKYSELVCLSPSELVRMSELMRSVCSSGDLTAHEAAVLAQRWRHSRNHTICRGTSRAPWGEMVEQRKDVAPTCTPYASVPPSVGHQLRKKNEVLDLNGCGPADGVYCEGLWMYKRLDGAVLAPVAGGWAIYESAQHMARCLLVSLGDHHAHLQPWEMGDWRTYEAKRCAPTLSVSVQPDDSHIEAPAWSEVSSSRADEIHVVTKLSLRPLEVVASDGTSGALYVRSVERYSLWESVGFEMGMRILAVDGMRGTPDQLSQYLDTVMLSAQNGFKVLVEPPSLWCAVSKDLDVSPNGREVRKVRGAKPSLACSQFIACRVWRVKVAGDVEGMRIGLCTTRLDHHLHEVDSGPNKGEGYWLLRCGTLRHNGTDCAVTSSFRSGDIITVTHDLVHRTVDFALNGKELGCKFTRVSDPLLRPCVYLAGKMATATLSPGAPVKGDMKWSEDRKSGIRLRSNGTLACLAPSTAMGVVTGEPVLAGPGPHVFEIKVAGNNLSETVFVGVAPPGVSLTHQFQASSMYGLTVRPDGNVFGLRESRILYRGPKPDTKLKQLLFTFIVDLGEGSVEVLCNGNRVVHTASAPGMSRAAGPLVPYAVIFQSDVTCELRSAGSRKPSTKPPAVIVRDTGSDPCSAEGLYQRWLPTYMRSDTRFSIYHWDNRWCVADAADTPCAWSNRCLPQHLLSADPLRWTIVANYETTPKYLRLVTPAGPGGILKLQGSTEGKVVYLNDTLKLSWHKQGQRWVIAPVSTPAVAYYISSPTSVWLPHCCSSWHRGDGAAWYLDDRVALEPCTPLVPLRQDALGIVWPAGQCAEGVDVPIDGDKPTPVISLSTTVCAKGPSVALDAMSPDELAGWHIVHKACGVLCKASELRVALKHAAEGLDNGRELRMEWATPESAQHAISTKAANQLDRIGRLLKEFKSVSPLDPLVSDNFSPGAKYGQLQAASIDTPVVDASRLSVADRKLFLLSLFNDSLRPYHVLDCTQHTPAEDVHAFLLLFKLSKKGRLAVFNLQELSPDLQNEVRQCADEPHSEKELIAVITEGDGTDETVSFVDNQTCDVRWRKWSMERAVKLSKFDSITYFCQAPGTGKSYTIQRQVELGVWGRMAPTLLDIDSTKTTLDDICKRLMAPLRATNGLLIIHIGHDTPHVVVNQVLDSLVFFGRIQSQSGLSVITPKRGWHLVVEFQHPPAPEMGMEVNDPWRKSDGTSDVTLLACRGLASQGSLIPLDVGAVKDAQEALLFLKKQCSDLPSENSALAKMLALGLSAVESTDTLLEAATPRLVTRALRFLVQQYRLFQPTVADIKTQSPTMRLVAQGLIHEMRHHVHPFGADHFHLCLKQHQIRGSVRLAGNTPDSVKIALDEYHKSTTHKLCVMRKAASLAEQKAAEEHDRANREELATAPMYSLVGTLADEVGVKKKWVTTCLSSQHYVLIPDFLQKLVQLRAHLYLKDPPILQGPSGTGKSCAVAVLCDLMQLPSETSTGTTVRAGYNDLSDTLFKRFVRSSELKRLFPSNNSDMEVGGSRVLWTAQCFKSTDKASECLQLLAENNLGAAVHYVRSSVNDVLGPLIRDTETNPDLADMLKDSAMSHAVDVMNGLSEEEPGVICDCLIKVMEGLSKVSGFFLAGQTTQCFESALRSEQMKELAGTSYDGLLKILDKQHTHDSFRVWAKHAYIKARNNKDEFCRQVRQILREELEAAPLLDPPPEVLEAIYESNSNGSLLGETICKVLDLKRDPSCFNILMRYDMTPELLFEEMQPILERALACSSVLFMVMIDEMNATKMLGLVKRIIVDRYWDKWEDLHPHTKGRMPDNVTFVGAVNPSKKDASLEGVDSEARSADNVEDLGFDVTPMPPSLLEYVVPWRQLAEDQRTMFISRLVAANKNIFSANIKESLIKTLGALLLGAHRFTQKLSQNKRTTVSQREIHRAMKLFDFFFNRRMDFVFSEGVHTNDSWLVALSSMLLGIAVSYYFRFPPDQRKLLSNYLSQLLKEHLGLSVCFADVVARCVSHFCNKKHLKLPEAVYSHQGLLENLFVQMICFDLRIAVILQGAPGTSKTLSNNIIRDNMTGTGPFWKQLCHISDVCRYQGSAQSSAEEIKRKCVEAYEKQKEADSSGTRNKRTLLFVDEAGLVNGVTDGRKWALKVLHYYLEGANLASVLMTNVSLDPAIGNRCIAVFMAKPQPEELANMCAGILHKDGFRGLTEKAKQIIPACCAAFRSLVPPAPEDEPPAETDPAAKYRWWYGLRDLFHMMRYVRRKNSAPDAAVDVSPELVVRALERNFNGPSEYFEHVLQVFGTTLSKIDASYATPALRELLRGRLSVFIDSLEDNNRALDTSSGKNLNDMWVRFKLLVDYTEDGSMLQLLRQSQVQQFADMSVLSLSALSGDDELMPVAVVSQIAAAMETGKSVWLTNTRSIDACLFDVFNQNYVVASSGSNEVLHFVAVAVGAALEYKRVHKDFQCVVHVTNGELAGMGRTLPSPFLNRLEKFTLSVDDVVGYLAAKLPQADRVAAAQCRQLLETFERTLSIKNRCIFSDTPRESFDSIVLEAIQSGGLRPLPVHPKLSGDSALQEFFSTDDPVRHIWRTMSCRLLQLLKPEGMLMAQRVLKEGAPAYLRGYFKGLAPWSFTGYMKSLQQRAKDTNEWLRSVIYTPNNVDFPSLVGLISGVTFVSVHDLLESERGHEDLKEALLQFAADTTQSAFVVAMHPRSLGKPECREVRDVLDADPVCGKAVVILQPFQCTLLTEGGGCTPIFGTGWDQVFIDAAAENAKIDLLRYVDADIMGTQAPRPLPEWKDMEALLYPAMNSLMQAQSKASTRWVRMAGDPAHALYDGNRPFGEQVAVVKKLFGICPAVRKTLLDLHCSRIPMKQEMVNMAKEVAAQGGALSMAQRLIDEENKAPRALLVIALRYLLTDRNASALLTLSNSQKASDQLGLQKSDAILSQALHITCQTTTFDMLRRMKVNSLETLVVGATMPTLPGSAFLMEVLEFNSNSVDAKQAAAELKQRYNRGPVGDLVALVEQEKDAVLAFFKDCIRARTRYTEVKVVAHTVAWVLELVRGLHYACFQAPETVWSVRALCVVEAAAIDDYILAMTPLAAMGALDHVKPHASLSTQKHEDEWVTHELSPKLLLDALPKMTSTATGLEQFRMACSSMLHRVTPEWAMRSRYIPCYAVVGAMLSVHTPALSQIIMFTRECAEVKGPVPLCLQSIRAVLDVTPQATSKVALELSRLSVHVQSSELSTFIVELGTSKYVPRAMAARVFTNITAPHQVLTSGFLPQLLLRIAESQTKVGEHHPPYAYCVPTKEAKGARRKESVLRAKIYAVAYDVCYDHVLGANAERLHEHYLIAQQYFAHVEAEKEYKCNAKLLYSAVFKRALEVSFLQALAFVFCRPPQTGADWEPTFMSNAEVVGEVSRLAKKLMEPKGYVCSGRGAPQTEIAPEKKENILIFINALQQGVGTTRGMGTKAVLEFLQDQVNSSEHSSALVTVCGEAMRHMCVNADALEAHPGDLPLVYSVDDQLYDAFLSLRAVVSNAAGNMVRKLAGKLKTLCSTFSKENVRLLLFYTAYKCYFGEKAVHPLAEEISKDSAIVQLLELKANQQRVLLIGFNNRKCLTFPNGSVSITDSLLEGFANEWTEMICTSLVIACAKPDSLFGSLFLDIDAQKSCYIPGDKTALAITEGGCYKIDCVTQLDENGKIAEYAKNQPVLSKGACYLLWGVEFGALAVQLTLFPDTYNTMAKWVVSPALHMRRYQYQQGVSDYKHLVSQLTERSIAYHLHMGTNTGLSVDEAQRLFTFFSYRGVMNGIAGKLQCRSRNEALDVEKEVEGFWKQHTQDKRMLSAPATNNSRTLMSLYSWMEDSQPDDLPRFGSVYTELTRMSVDKVPQLLDIALHDNDKLMLLAPLITDIYSFASRVHRMLSNRLNTKCTVRGDEQLTSYQGVLALFKEYTPRAQFEAALEQMSRIKHKWNTFMDKVGPIDFECEAGGINITMGEDMTVGAPGLPDTLDFWITMEDGSDPAHRNLVKAALMSLIDKYNKCQAIVVGFTKTAMEDVDPVMLNPSKPDLMLREHKGLGEVCRSHVTATGVDWAGIENELRFASGLILPRLLMPDLQNFRFVDPNEAASATEQSAAHLLAAHPERHNVPMPDQLAASLVSGARHFSEEQVVRALVGLSNAFKTHGLPEDDPLHTTLMRRWGAEAVPCSALKAARVCHLRAVMRFFLKKMECCDWTTAHINGDYQLELPDGLGEAFNERLQERLAQHALDEVIEDLEAMVENAGVMCNSGVGFLGDPKSSLMEPIAGAMMDSEGGICSLFEGVLVCHIVHFMRYLRRKLNWLRNQVSAKLWVEESASLHEAPLCVGQGDLGVTFDGLVVANVKADGTGAAAGVSKGMRVVALNGHRGSGLQDLLAKEAPPYELSIAVTPPVCHGTSCLAVLRDIVAPLPSGTTHAHVSSY